MRQAEAVVKTSEEMIGRERVARKTMARQLLNKTEQLTYMTHHEKQGLKDKVKTEIDPVIQMAKRDYQQLQGLNERTVDELK